MFFAVITLLVTVYSNKVRELSCSGCFVVLVFGNRRRFVNLFQFRGLLGGWDAYFGHFVVLGGKEAGYTVCPSSDELHGVNGHIRVHLDDGIGLDLDSFSREI